MGLDMYLYAKFFYCDFDFRPADHPMRVTCQKIIKAVGVTPTPANPNVYVDVCVAYWRKANAVHGWFVDNVQDGVDECQESYVSREQLQELLDACTETINNAIVEHPDNPPPDNIDDWFNWMSSSVSPDYPSVKFPDDFELPLPPRSGFFFGDTNTGAIYLYDLLDTRKQILDILNNPALKDADFYYRASW